MASTGEQHATTTGSSSISANTSQISLADQFARSTDEEIQAALEEMRLHICVFYFSIDPCIFPDGMVSLQLTPFN